MKNSKNAFTMIEVVFVIVILGILAAIAIPKFAATRTDAQVSKGRADIASIRSAIVSERQVRLIRGDSAWISQLHGLNAGYYFDGVDANHTLLMYGVTTQVADGHWHGYAATANGTHSYDYRLEGADNVLTYNPTNAAVVVNATNVPPGGFVCTTGARCADLTN